eukprot:521919_1
MSFNTIATCQQPGSIYAISNLVPYIAPYLEYAISIPIVIVLQSALLIHTIYQEYTKCNELRLALRILYIAIQVMGLYYTLMECVRFVIDPFIPLLRINHSCSFSGYSSKIMPSLYYGVYLYQILLRLQGSFKGIFAVT